MTRKICIATPVYGRPDAAMVSWAYHNAFAGLMRHPDVSSIGGTLVLNCDLVRARSRIVRMFLETDNTDLLMWDADVAPKDMNAIHAMVSSEKDVIALPYPRKSIHWEVIADNVRDEQEQSIHGRQTGSELEGYGLDWPLRILDQKHVDGIARVSEVGLGFTLDPPARSREDVRSLPGRARIPGQHRGPATPDSGLVPTVPQRR